MLTAADVDIKSPGRGLQPNAFDKLIGRTTHPRASTPGDFFYATDLGDGAPTRPRLRLPPPVGPGRALPRHRGDDAGHDPRLPRVPLLLQGPRPAGRRGVRAVPRRPADGLHAPTPPTSSPATSCSTSPPRTTPTGSGRSASSSASSTRPARCSSTSAGRRRRGATDGPVIVASLGGFTTDAFVAPAERRGDVRPGRRRPGPDRRLRRAALRPDPAALPVVHGRPALLQPLRRPARHRRVRASATTVGSASTSPTPSWRPTTSACPSPRRPTCWRRTPSTSTSSTRPASTARACRSATARSTGRCSPSSSTTLSPGRQLHPGDLAGTRQRRRGLLDRPGAARAMVLSRTHRALGDPRQRPGRRGAPRPRRRPRRHPRLAAGLPDAARRAAARAARGRRRRAGAARSAPTTGCGPRSRRCATRCARCGRRSCTRTCAYADIVAALAVGAVRASSPPSTASPATTSSTTSSAAKARGDGRRPHRPAAPLRRRHRRQPGHGRRDGREVAPARARHRDPQRRRPGRPRRRAQRRPAHPLAGPPRAREAPRRPGRRLRRAAPRPPGRRRSPSPAAATEEAALRRRSSGSA